LCRFVALGCGALATNRRRLDRLFTWAQRSAKPGVDLNQLRLIVIFGTALAVWRGGPQSPRHRFLSACVAPRIWRRRFVAMAPAGLLLPSALGGGLAEFVVADTRRRTGVHLGPTLKLAWFTSLIARPSFLLVVRLRQVAHEP